MTDAELIYNALLRAERRMEEAGSSLVEDGETPWAMMLLSLQREVVTAIREEIGKGLAKERE